MKGKTVFITGGAGGLGASAARYLAERGWQVFAADSDETALRGLEGEPNVTAVHLDVTDPASVEAARGIVAGACDGLDGGASSTSARRRAGRAECPSTAPTP